MTAPGYLHGYTDAEAERLYAQAEILAPYVLDGLDLGGVRTLLEVGVGVGAETRLLLRRWPELKIVGVDLEQGSLDRARQALAPAHARGQVSLVRGSGARLPLASASFDAAIFIWVLEHVPDPAALVSEAARCLRPGGRLYASEVYNRSLLIEPRRPVIDDYFAALCETQRRAHGHPDLAARLPELAERAGLEVTRFEFRHALGDGRDPARRAILLRYFEGIFRSAEPQVRAAGTFPAGRIPEVWRAFDEVVAAPDALLCYVGGRLEAVRRG